MDWEFQRADDGNIALTGELKLPPSRHFTLGIALGNSAHTAKTALVQSLATPFEQHRQRFIVQWGRVRHYLEPLEKASFDNGNLYRSSHRLLLAHEDKVHPGAIIASASIPWGQYKGDEDIGGYHLVWVRDMVQAATGLLATDDTTTAHRALVYLACSQKPDGGFAQNFWIDGTPYWQGVQLDQAAFPIMLAWRLWKQGALMDFDPYPMVLAAATYLVNQGPATQEDRWERNEGYSPSTLAAEIAALICAAEMARNRGQADIGQFLEQSADFIESHVEAWTVTSAGRILDGVKRHYIRILPTCGGGLPTEDPNSAPVELYNQPPGRPEMVCAGHGGCGLPGAGAVRHSQAGHEVD